MDDSNYGSNRITKAKLFKDYYAGGELTSNVKWKKIVLVTRMPDGSKEIMINDNVDSKIAYIGDRYDSDLRLLTCLGIQIEQYLLID